MPADNTPSDDAPEPVTADAPPGRKIHCPHCGVLLGKEDIAVIMFPQATVFACPRCKKSLALDSNTF